MENLPVHAVLHLCRQEDLQCVIGLAGLVEEILDLGSHGGCQLQLVGQISGTLLEVIDPLDALQ